MAVVSGDNARGKMRPREAKSLPRNVVGEPAGGTPRLPNQLEMGGPGFGNRRAKKEICGEARFDTGFKGSANGWVEEVFGGLRGNGDRSVAGLAN